MTLSPLLGFDSIEPYLRYEGKGAILLCRTSNPGGADLQDAAPRIRRARLRADRPARRRRLEQRAARSASSSARPIPAEIARVREIAPTLPLLIPGIGAQGGDAAATVRAGWRGNAERTTGPIIVSSSRAVLYAGSGADYAERAHAPSARRSSPTHRRLRRARRARSCAARTGPAPPSRREGLGKAAILSAPRLRQSLAAAATAAAAARAGAAR